LQNYTKRGLYSILNEVDWNITNDLVQSFWNQFKNIFLSVIKIVPVNSKSLWQAIKDSKDFKVSKLPNTMFESDQ
jgi:hypothetical protein